MALQGWQRLYLDALQRSRTDRIQQYETVEFIASVMDEPPTGVQELLLHRTIARLATVEHAVALLKLIRDTHLGVYGPRILARIADTEAVLKVHPELDEHLQSLRKRTGYTTASLKQWRMLSDGTHLLFPGAPVWTGRSTPITTIIEELTPGTLSIDDAAQVIEYFFARDFRIYQIALITFTTDDTVWAETLHQILAAPYIAIAGEHEPVDDKSVTINPAPHWSPHWQVTAQPEQQPRWRIQELHTGKNVHGINTAGIFDQISVLLALTGLLREGINLSPIDRGLARALTPSHPIWGFRHRDFAAARTTYQDKDIRALALGFLETMPASERVSIFRSRLALYFGNASWENRAAASAVTAENGFYKHFIRAAQLMAQNRFDDVATYVQDNPYGFEPAFQFLAAEATAAKTLFERLERTQNISAPPAAARSEEILCVTHASVPDQTGGYAIRAQGILKSLQDHGVQISAVTRPGFPAGALTADSTVIVNDIRYRRLPATSVTRNHGEAQYMTSFIEPFKALFQQQGIGTVHVRSTFLIALPALIAARELGLNVLYEVSGLWELVYQDREEAAHLMKRAPFAELAETVTMRNVDQLVVMNDAVRQIALDRGVAAVKIQVAHNAVDIESFAPMEPPKNPVFTIGYLGSFQDYEGLDDMVDVTKLLQEQGTAIRVLMVGDGLRYNPVHSRIVTEGLEDSFTLTGRVPHQEVMDYYRQMDVLVYPRQSTGATETITPLKPFEALALAKPIIVSDVEPLREIVGDDQRGLVFESGNVPDFARAIKQFEQDRSLMTRLGQAGRTWVVEHRNWENVVEAFKEAYDQLR